MPFIQSLSFVDGWVLVLKFYVLLFFIRFEIKGSGVKTNRDTCLLYII